MTMSQSISDLFWRQRGTTTMITELYDALKDAGAAEDKARKAAETVAAYPNLISAWHCRRSTCRAPDEAETGAAVAAGNRGVIAFVEALSP